MIDETLSIQCQQRMEAMEWDVQIAPWDMEDIFLHLQERDGFGSLCVKHHVLYGHVLWTVERDLITLERLTVDRERWGKGYGSELLDTFYVNARQSYRELIENPKDVVACLVSVEHDNPGAIRWLAKRGWQHHRNIVIDDISQVELTTELVIHQ